MTDHARKIRALHAAGVDPVEICCRLLVSWRTVESALFVPLDTNTEPAPVAHPVEDVPTPAPEPEVEPELMLAPTPTPATPTPTPEPAPAKRTDPSREASPTPAAMRSADEAAIKAFLRENSPTRAVDFGEDAPAILYLRRCGFVVYGSPPALKKRGRWMINGSAHTTKALWQRASKEARRRGEAPPVKRRPA